MPAMIIKQFMTHFGVGVAFGLIVMVYYMLFQKRRVLLCFGGEPLSLGMWRRWMGWYFIALLFEVVSSFLMHEKYFEIALSPIQAVAFTIGLFFIDRFGKIFVEPDYVEVMPDKPDSSEKQNSLPPQTFSELPAHVAHMDGDENGDMERIAVVIEVPRPRSWFRKKLDGWKDGSKRNQNGVEMSEKPENDTIQELNSLLKDH